jgi:hypothetical protein
MNPKNFMLCVLFTFLASAAAIAYPDIPAEKLIIRHLEASGGINALGNMATISRHGRIVFYTQENAMRHYCYHTDLVYPKKLREQLKNTHEILHERGTDGDLFWIWNKAQYEYIEDENLKEDMIDTATRANRDLLWVLDEADNFEVMQSLPSWAAANSQCIQEINANNANQRIYCFDEKTGLENATGTLEEHRMFSQWTKVGNIKIPFRLTHYVNNIVVYEISLDWATLNEDIADIQFQKPTSALFSCVL